MLGRPQCKVPVWRSAWSDAYDADPDTALIEAVNFGKNPWHSGGTTVYLAQDASGNIYLTGYFTGTTFTLGFVILTFAVQRFRKTLS